ncbi:CAAX amino terminal protease self- immunity [compost metagenome]
MKGRAGSGSRDFPFYEGKPIDLSAGGWLVVMLGCVVGFSALITLPAMLSGEAGPLPVLASLPARLAHWIGVTAFAVVPILGLILAAGRNWTAVFPAPRWKDLWIGIAFLPVTWTVSIAAALAVRAISSTSGNPVNALLNGMATGERVEFFAATLPQLFGEELVTILPFLALLTLFRLVLKLPRLGAVILAWIASALIFGALHLPTYDWHWLQAFGIIGSARLALTLPYLVTKSPWASAATHILNDWTIFGILIVLHTTS